MMTSSNGNMFRFTGPLCGEFTGHQWIPLTKTSDAEPWCFSLICAWINGWVNNREAGGLRRHRTHYDGIVMFSNHDHHFGRDSQSHAHMYQGINICLTFNPSHFAYVPARCNQRDCICTVSLVQHQLIYSANRQRKMLVSVWVTNKIQ